MAKIKLPRLSTGWDQEVGLFARYWNAAMDTIETNINDILFAQETADGAQTSADGAQLSADNAQDSADAAQGTADDALDLANTSVQQDVGPVWAASTGSASRAAYSSYSAPSIPDPPTGPDVQGVADGLQAASQAIVALIADLRANGALTD